MGNDTVVRLEMAVASIPIKPYFLRLQELMNEFVALYKGIVERYQQAKIDISSVLNLLQMRMEQLQQQIPLTTSETVRNKLNEELTKIDQILQKINAYEQKENVEDNDQLLNLYAEGLALISGYKLEFGPSFTDDAQKLNALGTLATANTEIIKFLQEIRGGTGFALFRQYYAKSPHSDDNQNRIIVILGSDKPKSKWEGFVPLPISVDDPYELSKIYLGPLVSVGTVIHEYTHQLDRYFKQQLSNELSSIGLNQYMINSKPSLRMEENYLLGRANPDTDPAEVFADYGMTTILTKKNYRLADAEDIFTDPKNNEVIGWDPNSDNAQAASEMARCYFYKLFGGDC